MMNLRWVVLVGVACSPKPAAPIAVAPPPPPKVAIPAPPLVFSACQPDDKPAPITDRGRTIVPPTRNKG
ncbi:MAG: hypothetical protein H0T79_16010, partial [Deltaproteobacteria bacterium]|nr:hypothetical protein [Deltaproteobacteria bacterium]